MEEEKKIFADRKRKRKKKRKTKKKKKEGEKCSHEKSQMFERPSGNLLKI